MSDQAGVPTCYRHPDRETYISCQRCQRPICPDCMRDASVGFQCPECVAAGRKEMRRGRTAYGGLVPERPGAITTALIGINVVVFLAIQATGRYGSSIYQHLALITTPLSCPPQLGPNCRVPAGISGGHEWELITSVFTHVDVIHILFNMYVLWVLGPQLEAALGRLRFVALYLLSGLAGSVSVIWLSNGFGATVGASGAIFGLLGALLVIGHKAGADLGPLWMLLGINLVFTFAVSGISWQAHLGGLAGGAICAAVLAYAPRERRGQVQWLGLAGFLVVLIAAAAVRVAISA